MIGGKWVLGALFVASIQVLVTSALGGYPGTFYRIMMMLNRDRKNPRTAPSPNQLWAILDPPASLGSLGGAPLRTNRIIRSASENSDEINRRQARQEPEIEPESLNNQEVFINQDESVEPSVNGNERDELPGNERDELRVNEEPTEPPVDQEETTEVSVDEEEAETEPPVTTEAPIVCGGDIYLELDPHNITAPESRFLYEILETPGFEEGEYPEDIECTWNVIVGDDCLMGLVTLTVMEGEIRDTAGCNQDYLKFIYESGIENRYCGTVVVGNYKVSGTDLWTLMSETPRTTQIVFKSVVRQPNSGGGNAKGVKIEVAGYCWAFTPDFISRTTTTTTTTTTTEAPTEAPEVDEGTFEVVTEIAEDPLALEADTDEASDTVLNEQVAKEVVEDPILDAGNSLDAQESQLQEAPIPAQPELLEEVVSEESVSEGSVVSVDPVSEDPVPEGSVVSVDPVSEEPVSLLGSESLGGGGPSQLLPSGPVPSASGGPILPVVPAAASPGGFIPIVPLRDASEEIMTPSEILSKVQPIVTQLLNNQKK